MVKLLEENEQSIEQKEEEATTTETNESTAPDTIVQEVAEVAQPWVVAYGCFVL
jgi:hypothetical protein